MQQTFIVRRYRYDKAIFTMTASLPQNIMFAQQLLKYAPLGLPTSLVCRPGLAASGEAMLKTSAAVNPRLRCKKMSDPMLFIRIKGFRFARKGYLRAQIASYCVFHTKLNRDFAVFWTGARKIWGGSPRQPLNSTGSDDDRSKIGMSTSMTGRQ